MKIKLNVDELNCLKEAIEHEQLKFDIELKGLEKPDQFILIVNEDQATDLREICSDYLLRVGFDKDYVANKKGTILETLVDRLYVP